MFELTEELCDGLPAYRRMGSGSEMWMEFNASLSKWMVRQGVSRGTNKGYAHCSVAGGSRLPQDCTPGTWQVWSNNLFDSQAAVTVVLLSPLPRQI